MTKRVQQVASTVREAIQQVIQKGLNDPRVRGLVTVTRVTVSEDLREATVFVSVLPEEHEKLTMHGLEAASRYIRREAAELVALSRMPTLKFKVDRGMKNQAAVFRALGEIKAEDEKVGDEKGKDPDQRGPESTDGGSER